MTITRIWQAGAELQHVNELEAYTSVLVSTTPATISNTKAKTGTYSFRFQDYTFPIGASCSTTQIRANAFMNHLGVDASASTKAMLIYITVATISDIRVYWVQSTGLLTLEVNGSVVDTIDVSVAGFSNTDTWYSVGVTCKTDSSTGFVSIYIDGIQVLTWTGNTGSLIDGVYYGGNAGSSSIAGWDNYLYMDDFYVDDTVGEADAAPPSPRFSFLLPNGAGNYTNWTPNTGSNYAAVDETGAPDDETTYVYATSSGVQDSYALTNTTAGVTVPAGYAIDAVIPIAWARKTDAGTASTLKLGTRLSGTNAIGSAQSLATSFGPVWERQTTDPGAGAWSEADIDSTEIVLESAGAY